MIPDASSKYSPTCRHCAVATTRINSTDSNLTVGIAKEASNFLQADCAMYAGYQPVSILKEGYLGLASKPACTHTHTLCQPDSKWLHLPLLYRINIPACCVYVRDCFARIVKAV